MMTPIKIIMRDGSECDDESISWNYDEDEHGNILDKSLAYVMDFTETFPYWKELKAPEGYNEVEKIDDVWYWVSK